MAFQREREDLVAHGQSLVTSGLCVGTSGNLSIRCDDVVVLTPSGIPYDRLQPESMCVVTLDGEIVEAPSPPSSETPMHLSVYRSTPAQAVVHTHSPYATVLSTVVEELPPIHYVIAGLGGSVRVAPYATFGTRELADNMAEGLEGRTAVILQNHGTITYGRTLEAAFTRSVTLEWLATLYWRATLFGSPHLLDDAEIDRVRKEAKVKGYRRAEAPK